MVNDRFDLKGSCHDLPQEMTEAISHLLKSMVSYLHKFLQGYLAFSIFATLGLLIVRLEQLAT